MINRTPAVKGGGSNNLAINPRFEMIRKEHRNELENWVKETNDQGQYPEEAAQLKATYDMWKDRPRFRDAKVNPEYNQFINASETF